MEIRIGKCARACKACERAFEHEQPLKSVARLENQALVREDYCESCWKSDLAQGSFSVWVVSYYDPTVAEQEPPEVFSPLRQAFYESVESEDPVQMAKAYLASQLLRRQKVFRLIKEAQDPDTNERVALFSDRIGNTLVEVRDPSLSYEHLEAGRRALLARLNELENPSAEEPAADDVPESQEAAAVDAAEAGTPEATEPVAEPPEVNAPGIEPMEAEEPGTEQSEDAEAETADEALENADHA